MIEKNQHQQLQDSIQSNPFALEVLLGGRFFLGPSLGSWSLNLIKYVRHWLVAVLTEGFKKAI